ncbi:hypothetical protein [Streptomyces longwoodensis]
MPRIHGIRVTWFVTATGYHSRAGVSGAALHDSQVLIFGPRLL